MTDLDKVAQTAREYLAAHPGGLEAALRAHWMSGAEVPPQILAYAEHLAALAGALDFPDETEKEPAVTDLEKITERLRTCSDRWTLSVVAAEVERMMRECAERAFVAGLRARSAAPGEPFTRVTLAADFPLLP